MNAPSPIAKDTDYVLIHGYTGSTCDFGDLATRLGNMPGASVWCPLLPGHGTVIEDLIGLTYTQIYGELEREVEKKIFGGRKVVLIGISLGAQVALSLAAKYRVAGVVAIAITHGFKFPLNLKLLRPLAHTKRRWKKHFTSAELHYHAMEENFSYGEMLSDGWFLSHALRREVDLGAKHITSPILFVHSMHEKLADPSAIAPLSRTIPSPVTVRLLPNDCHNVFYSSAKEEATRLIVSFAQELMDCKNEGGRKLERVTAIIPAYNESERIRTVLGALTRVSMIDEIIVVDDGSSDGTEEVVRRFRGVTLVTNKMNIGKGASMDRGVKMAKNDVIFFCDADLLSFTKEDAEAIITPVIDGRYDMYIGMRGNFMQRAVRAWGLNSGERALRKEVWQSLPAYYKYRYRIEVGLNRQVMRYGFRGLGWKMFKYTQPTKESKYGFLRGTLLRWWMNFDVLSAYIAFPMITSLTGSRQKGGE